MNRIVGTGAVFGLFLLAIFVYGSDETRPDAERADAKPSQAKPADEQSVREAKEFAERSAVEAGLWEIVLNDGRTTATAPREPALRWSWSNNGRLYGDVYVYSAHGRPVAIVGICQFFSPIQGVFFQCTSLTDVPLKATRDGREIWAPATNNAIMHDVPDAPAPAKTAGTRLIQMRRMAEDFKAEVDDKLGVDPVYTVRPLRLLSRPIFRYGNAEGDYLDGAIFAYAINTDAAVMLILEAVRSETGVRWRYGFPRSWSYSGRATYQGKPVWEFKEINPRLDSKANFYLNELPRTIK
jgi:hypothetical protein